MHDPSAQGLGAARGGPQDRTLLTHLCVAATVDPVSVGRVHNVALRGNRLVGDVAVDHDVFSRHRRRHRHRVERHAEHEPEAEREHAVPQAE